MTDEELLELPPRSAIEAKKIQELFPLPPKDPEEPEELDLRPW